MAGESIVKICRQQLDDSRNSEYKILNFPDLVEISNFECDRAASKSTSSKNHILTLVQVYKSQENLLASSLVGCNDSGQQLDKPGPFFKECILNMTLPVVDKSNRCQFLNTNQQLVGKSNYISSAIIVQNGKSG